MIFFLNLNGTCTRQDTDHIYQGSNNVSKVIAITGIAPGQSHVDVAFTLPNGLTVGYLPMAYKGAYKLEDSSAVSMHLWELNLSYNVTEMQGTIGVSFNAVTGITEENPKGNNLTSYTNTFEVEYSSLPIPPSSATESELEQILNLLEAYAAVNSGIVEKLENFQIGTITARSIDAGSEPQVVAKVINQDVPNRFLLNMDFTLPRGEQGPPGEITGAVAGVKGNEETEYRQGLVNITPENIGAPSTSGTYEDLSVGSATSLTRHSLTSADDLDNIKNEGYYVWIDEQPKNSPCAYASMIIMWASSDNFPKQIVFRQGSQTNANGQYTSDEIWLRSYDGNNDVWTDWVLIPTLRYLTSNFSNRNLLANPTFEINQRGLSKYTGSANYTVDRWKSISANNIIEVISNGIRFTNGYSSNSYIKQILEENYSGVTLTFSAKISAISAGSARMAMYYTTVDNPNTWTLIGSGLTIDNTGIHSLTVTIPNSALRVSADLGGTGRAVIEYQWTKLEYGLSATRFEQPDTSTELSKCQRYYYAIGRGENKNNYAIISGLCFGFASNQVRTLLKTPIPMRKSPSITMNGSFSATKTSGPTNAVESISIQYFDEDNIAIMVTTSNTIVVGDTYILQRNNDTSANIEFDAEL